ncbi:small multi-drug export protein [bacterium]|nr:small multi-drug export protein [bacterium]
MEIAQFIADHLRNVSTDMVTVFIAMLPVAELRGAIPWAITLGDLPVWRAVVFSIIGNMIPIPFILILLGPVSNYLSRWRVFDRFFQWLFARTRKRSNALEKYEALGLILFVGIPLPITGAWTGSVAAFLFGIPLKRSLLYIFIGVCMSATIVTLTSVGLVGFVGMFR